jgi:diguanylate cyclase (GGDEF)-like protein
MHCEEESMIRSRVNEPLMMDRVADTTSHRERGALDGAIVQMLGEFLDSRSVVLYQLLQGDSHTRVMRRRAAYGHGRLQAQSRVRQDLVNLPKLTDRPEWQTCVDGRRPVQGAPVSGRSIICFPVEEGANVTGLLEIELSGSMSARDTRLVECVLRILRNQIALLEYGERDTLTGLLNRKTFESRFVKLCAELPQVTSTAQPTCWLGLLDIDRFKSINDTYGHVMGDEVLLLVSQIMQRTLRGGDQLFRFGGEEFVVVLEDTNVAGADIAFERIRTAIENHRFPQIGAVTASLGYTTIRPQEVPAICIERADAALYFVKHHGRNGVRCFEHLVESGAITPKENSGDVELF